MDTQELNKRYRQHKANTIRRKIGFNLTFEEWLLIWNDSGKLHLRGKGTGRYCMVRDIQSLPYEVGNVSIRNNNENITAIQRTPSRRAAHSKAMTGQKRTEAQKANMKAAAQKRNVGKPAPVRVEILGVVYDSIGHAAIGTGWSRPTISKRIARGYEGYKKL